jgi:hypothetical protein
VTKEIAEKRANKSKILLYYVNLDRVLDRLRFGRVLQQSRDVAGLLGHVMMEELIFLGQASLKRLVASVVEVVDTQSYHHLPEADRLRQLPPVELQQEVTTVAFLTT